MPNLGVPVEGAHVAAAPEPVAAQPEALAEDGVPVHPAVQPSQQLELLALRGRPDPPLGQGTQALPQVRVPGEVAPGAADRRAAHQGHRVQVREDEEEGALGEGAQPVLAVGRAVLVQHRLQQHRQQVVLGLATLGLQGWVARLAVAIQSKSHSYPI